MRLENLADYRQHIETIAFWRHTQWGYLYAHRSIEEVLAQINSELGHSSIPATFIFMQDQNPIATSALVNCDMECHDQLSPWMASIYVLPKYRKNGIGTQLVLATMQKAKDFGAKDLFLFTPDQDKWYQKMGWITLEEPQYHNERVTVMKTDLQNKVSIKSVT